MAEQPNKTAPDFQPAIIRGLERRFKAVLAACELAEGEARHVIDDEVYVCVGLIRNALNGLDEPSILPGNPTSQPTDGADQ